MENLGLDVAKSALMTRSLLAITLDQCNDLFCQSMDMYFVLIEMSRLSPVT